MGKNEEVSHRLSVLTKPVVGQYKKSSWRRRIVYGVIIVAVAIGAFIAWRTFTKESDFTLEKVRYDAITELVSETGNVTTAGVTPLYSTTNGMVDEVLVSNGDVVVEDDVLFSVKSTATHQEQEVALSSYLAAKADLEAARATQLSLQAAMFGKWDTFKELAQSDEFENSDGTPKHVQRAVPEFHIPEKEWLSAEVAYKNQQQVIAQKQAAHSAAWRAYEATQDSQVIAVLGGTVKNLSVARGDAVVVPTTLTLSSTKPALVLVDEGVQTMVRLSVNEVDVVKVKQGQSAVVELDAVSDKTFKARVQRVDTIADTTGDVVSFQVYVELLQTSNSIKQGMSADVDITVAQKEKVLTVPSSAIKPYQGGRAVRIIGDGGEIEFVPVKTGSRGDNRVEIVSGIDEGTEVVTTLKTDKKSSGGFF